MPVALSGVSASSGDSGWDNETKDPDKVKLISPLGYIIKDKRPVFDNKTGRLSCLVSCC